MGGVAKERFRSRAIHFCVAVLLGHYDTAVEVLTRDMPVGDLHGNAMTELIEELAVQS